MKIAIVLDEELGKGFIANAAACIASGLFNNEKNLLGAEINGKDCTFIPITKIPILILKKNKQTWSELLEIAKSKKLKYMVFTQEGQSTISYDEYIERVKDKHISELTIVGFGVFGEDKIINSFSGNLPLLH